MNKEFYDRLEQSLQGYGHELLRREALEETRQKCARIQGRKRKPVSWSAFFFSQLRFIGGKIWALEAAVLLILFVLLNGILRNPVWEPDYGEICFLLSATAAVSAMAGIPYLYRSRRYGMDEIECATRVSYSALQALRLLMAVAGNLIMLAVLFAAACVRAMLPAVSAVYLLLPFFCVWAGSLLILRESGNSRSSLYCMIFGTGLIALLFFLNKTAPRIFEPEAAVVWGVLCVIVFGILLAQVGIFRRKLWN